MKTYEICKGIFITQQLITKERAARDSTSSIEATHNVSGVRVREQIYKESSYAFKIDVRILQIVDATFDFSESECLILEQHEGLICTSTIQPHSSGIVAVLRLGKGWRLKYKIRLSIRTPPISVQWRYIKPQFESLQSIIKIAIYSLYKIPMEKLPLENIFLHTLKHNISFIDPEFPPNDGSIYGNSQMRFDFIVHWRKPSEYIALPSSHYLIIPSYISLQDINIGISPKWLVSAIEAIAEYPPIVYE